MQEEAWAGCNGNAKKATAKTEAKRKKAAVKASTRRTTPTARKTRLISKKARKKAPLRGASPRKARSTAPDSGQAGPPPAEPAASEERIGVVTHYYSHLSVAAIQLERGTLRVGDVIHICGRTHRFPPEGRVSRGRPCADDRSGAEGRFRPKGGRPRA